MNSRSDALVSIVIPTKNRYETLRSVVEATLDAIPDPRLEVVIQDNSTDNAEALRWLEQVDDARIVYGHLPADVSIVVNTEEAFGRVSGKYVVFIGDDDLVSPHVMRIAELLERSGLEALTYPFAYYWWPSVKFTKPSRYYSPGAFWYPRETGRAPQVVDSKAALERVEREGAGALFDLPRVYHGLVARAALDRMRSATGRLVNGASPDMALAVGLAAAVDRHVLLDFPVTIYGASRNSGGGWTVENRHHGRLENQKHLPKSTIERWNPKLPRLWSEHTIYAQTLGEVMSALGRPDDLNYTAFYASAFVNEPHVRDLLVPLIRAHLAGRPGRIPAFARALARKVGGKLKRSLQNRVAGMPYALSHFMSVEECVAFLSSLEPPRLELSRCEDA